MGGEDPGGYPTLRQSVSELPLGSTFGATMAVGEFAKLARGFVEPEGVVYVCFASAAA